MRTILMSISLLLSAAVSATPVTWDVDVSLSDGGHLFGSFTHDADFGTYTDILLETDMSGSAWLNGGEFTTFYGNAWGGTPLAPEFYGTCGTVAGRGPGTCHVVFFFAEELTNAGGVVAIDSSQDFAALEAIYEMDEYAYLTSGTVTASAVPIPAAVWLFGSALAGLGWMRRKQAV